MHSTSARCFLGSFFLCCAGHTMRLGIAGFTVVFDEQAMLAGYGHKSRREGLWCTCEHFCWLGFCPATVLHNAGLHACMRKGCWLVYMVLTASSSQVGGRVSCQHSMQIFSTTWKGFCAVPLVGWGCSSCGGVDVSQNRAGSPDVP